MAGKRGTYWALWVFLTGIVLVVAIQFISGKSIETLISGNQRLLQEVRMQNSLRRLEAHLLTLDANLRETADSAQSASIEQGADSVRSQLQTLLTSFTDSLSRREGAALQGLVDRYLSQTGTYTAALQVEGALVPALPAQHLSRTRDSIVRVINDLDSRRTVYSTGDASFRSNAGLQAKVLSWTLAVLACLAAIAAFWHMLQRGAQQDRVIGLLAESERRMEETTQLKEQFLANISHEIRTPLNAVLGFTQLLRKTELAPQQQQYADYIYSSGENLLAIINDVLDLSKIEAGMMRLEEAPFSLAGLVRSVEIMFGNKAAEKGLALKMEIAHDVPDALCGDAVRLTQILINLLSNALKFTEKGKVELCIEKGVQQGKALMIRFTVSDTGIGMAPEAEARIFDRFQQAEAETTRRFGGSGLGLSIVKQLVGLQGGSIELESASGKGSTFRVWLPFEPAPLPLLPVPIEKIETAPKLAGMQVLVAEDNALNSQLIEHLLKGWGAGYHLVANGKEALAALRTQPFDAVLMDIEMPLLNGYDAARQVRQELGSAVPIIAMTAHALPGERDRCLRAGMTDFITKPVQERALYTALHACMPTAAATKADTAPVVSLQYLHDLSGGDAAFERLIIAQFIEQLPQELRLLAAAVDAGIRSDIRTLAHGIKSTVGYLGLHERLHPLLERMEREAEEGTHPAHFSADLQELRRIAGRAIVEAAAMLEEEPQPLSLA